MTKLETNKQTMKDQDKHVQRTHRLQVENEHINTKEEAKINKQRGIEKSEETNKQ